MIKKIIFIMILLSIYQANAAPSDDFIIRVQTNFLGVTGADQFKIPTLASLTYNYDVDCNDDTINEAVGVSGDYICDYSSLGGVGIYTIRIKLTAGTGFPRIYFNGGGDKDKILSVEQWGKNKWASMNSAFEGAIHLSSTATDSPDLSNATSLAQMFKNATSVNPNTTNWETSTITSFTGMFQGATNANPNVSNWNTSLVQRFKYMFDGASSANPNTSLWDSSSVIQMEYMFRNATSANPNLTNWNIENVTSIQGMFEGVTLPTSTYDTILSTFAIQNVNTGLSFDGGNSKFCAQNAHNILDIDKSWTITDAGLEANCPSDFVITIKTDHMGDSADNEFTIPTKSGETYDYSVDCDNDGSNEIVGATGDYTCVYPSTGTYTLRIKYNQLTNAGFPQIYFNGLGDDDKLLTIEQWGTNPWTSMQRAFLGASHLTTTATDSPNFSNMISVVEMFRDATSANPNTSNWDTSSIQHMDGMFSNATLANPDTSNWDVAAVNSMVSMFINATSANPDTSNWNIGNVTSMNFMFNGVTLPTADYDAMLIAFSQQTVKQNVLFHGGNSKFCSQAAHDVLDIDNNWTITDGGLDANCPDPLDDFIITVKTDHPGTSADNEFTIPTESGETYDYSVDCDNDGTNEIIGATGNYTCVYTSAGTYTVRIKYNKVTNSGFPRITFSGVRDSKKLLTIEQWGTNPWTSMSRAFEGTSHLTTTAMDTPNFLNMTSMLQMFKDATIVTPNTSNWDTSSIENMISMFQDATLANPDTSNWNTSGVTTMRSMFNGATQANPNTSNWDTSKVEYMNQMFRNAEQANPDTSNWNTSEVLWMIDMFSGATLANPNTSNWNTAKVTRMEFMFNGATSAIPDTSNWNIEKVTDMFSMFSGVTLPTANYDAMLIGFSQQNVKQNVFFHGGNSKYCSQAAHDILDIDNSWNMTDGGLDTNCPGPLDGFIIEVDTTILGQTSNPSTEFEINTIGGGYNYNVDCDDNNAGTNTATGQTGNYTCNYTIPGIYTIRISDNIGDKTGFPRIYSIPHLDADKIINLKQWGTGAWDSMSAAFIRATNMTVTATDIPDLSNVLDMGAMFAYASSANPDVSGWNTANVTTMHSMFIDATSATPDISNWDLSGITVPNSMDSMLNGISLPRALYDTTLANFDAQITVSGIVFDAGNSKYCNVVAHDSLINTHGWTITDGGLDTNCPPLVEDVFSNGFEDVIIFKSQEAQFVYDFSQVSVNELDQMPLLIAKGINNQHQPTLLIYLRDDLGQLQIRKDFIDEENQWIQGLWKSIENNKNTLIHWNEKKPSEHEKQAASHE